MEDAQFCTDLGANALGFIFYNKSKRFISPEIAAEIISKLPPFIIKVGVFVNENANYVNGIAKQVGLNSVQLHGDESDKYIKEINLPVIKSFRIHENFNWNILENFSRCNILLDSYSEKEMGGTGNTFNWKRIPDDIKNKIILSGGISVNNLESVFEYVNPAAIDISSSLEIEPGKKDHKKVKEFFENFNHLRSK